MDMSLSFLEYLNQEGDAPESEYIKFLTQYKSNGKTVHFFIEGEDDQAFYVNYINFFLPRGFKAYYYICNGKKNVLQNYVDIQWSFYKKNRVLFFIDKDFDDILGRSRRFASNIYVTDYYSIENYVVNEYIYERFLREICGLNMLNNIDILKKRFNEQYHLFCDLLIPFLSWIIYCMKNMLPITINEIDLSKLFKIDDNLKVCKENSSGYTSAFRYICDVSNVNEFKLKEVLQCARLLQKITDPKIYMRGKFEIWFFLNFCSRTMECVIPKLNKEIAQYNRKTKDKISKCKVRMHISKENILPVFAPRVPIPDSLREFLICNMSTL